MNYNIKVPESSLADTLPKRKKSYRNVDIEKA